MSKKPAKIIVPIFGGLALAASVIIPLCLHNWNRTDSDNLTVTFDLGEGHIEGLTGNQMQVLEGTTFGQLPTPILDDYYFSFWTVNGQAMSPVDKITTDVTVKANYSPAPVQVVKVQFDLKGGSISGITGDWTWFPVGGTFGLLPTPYKTDSLFTYWTVNGQQKAPTDVITSDITVVANYEAVSPIEQITITFDLDGGEIIGLPETNKMNVSVGSKYGQLPTPAKADFIFDHWTVNGVAVDFATVIPGSVTVKAVYEPFSPIDEIENYCYVPIDGVNWIIDNSSLSDMNQPIKLINSKNETQTQTIARSNFTTYDVVVGKLISKLGDKFLTSCPNFVGTVTLQNGLQQIGADFLINCENFNGEINIPSTVTTIGSGFMWNCKKFSHALNLSKVTIIGDDFLGNCESFNASVNMPMVQEIGLNFMNSCIKFNQPLVIPSTTTSVLSGFLCCCDSMKSELTINSAICWTTDERTCATTNASAEMYTAGIPIAGTQASAFKLLFPNPSGSTSWYRNLK